MSSARTCKKNWAVVAEAIQTILRREGYPEPYEALKALTRTHSVMDENTIAEFINTLDLPKSVKKGAIKNYAGKLHRDLQLWLKAD